MIRVSRVQNSTMSGLRKTTGSTKLGTAAGSQLVKSQLAHLTKFASDRLKVRKAASELALELDTAWKGNLSHPTGPIDVVDMFAGCGGMSAGFLAANSVIPAYRLAMAVDIDELAMQTYEANLGLKPCAVDLHRFAKRQTGIVKQVHEARLSKANPLVLIGCAPCQGFSSHRNAHGHSDSRNSLFVTFARIAAAIGPDAIIVENVPEVITDQYWPVMVEARRILNRAGYQTVLTAHDMSEFGVPQQRYRAVMIAMRRPFRMPRGFLGGEERRTVRQAIGALPEIAAGEVCSTDPMHFTAGHRPSTIQTIMAVPLDGGRRPPNVGPECLRRAADRQGRSAYDDVYGRLWWDKPSITITGHARNPASGRYVHPTQHRGLSVREAALLQGFPSRWLFSGGLGPAFMQVGNAVPPAFAAFLAVHMIGEMMGPAVEKLDTEVDITQSVGPSFSRLIPALKAGHRHLHPPAL